MIPYNRYNLRELLGRSGLYANREFWRGIALAYACPGSVSEINPRTIQIIYRIVSFEMRSDRLYDFCLLFVRTVGTPFFCLIHFRKF